MCQILHVAWPQELRPGDERYVENALTLAKDHSTVRLTFLFDDDIFVLGAYAVSRNVFLFPRNSRIHKLGLKYVAAKNSRVASIKDIAFVLHRRKVVPWRLAFIGFLVGLVLIPPVHYAFRIEWLSVHIAVGDAVLTSIPLGVVLAGVLSWRRLLPILGDLVTRDVVQHQVVGESGTSIGSIKIVDSQPSPDIRNWHVDDE